MDERRGSALAIAACAVSGLFALGILAIWAVLELDASYELADSRSTIAGDLLMAIAFAAVGGLVTIKRPGNLVGWALSLAGFGLLFGGLLGAYAELAVLAKPEEGLPGGAAAWAISSGSWTPLMAGVFLLLLVFPQGRFPSRRWRRLAVFILAGFAVVWIGITTAPELDPPFEAVENPFAFTNTDTYLFPFYLLIIACLLGAAAAAINLLLRFRRSRGQERQQFKWLAASAGFLLVTFPIFAAFDYSGIAGTVASAALIALPVSVGIAVLRYRLYEIDRIVNRTVVYAAVTALLAGLYFGIVIGLQQIFSGLTRGNDLAIAGSTLAVAALFRPVRTRIQAFVDRRFYRRRYDAQQTLEAFNARLRDEIDLDELESDLGAVVNETLQPAHVSLWIRPRFDAVTHPVTISGRSDDRKDWR
jgi:hypothetical protein